MKRAFILLSGLGLSGIFAVVMYMVFGNLNWGSEAENNLPWFEPTFWLIASSGVVVLIIYDLAKMIRRRTTHREQRR